MEMRSHSDYLHIQFGWLIQFFLVLLGSKASIEIDDERTATLIEKVNEILEAFIGIDDLELGKQKKRAPLSAELIMFRWGYLLDISLHIRVFGTLEY